MFLLFLMFAAHLTIHLYGSSTVAGTLHDAARRVASDPTGYGCDRAVADVVAALGDYGGRDDVAVTCAGDDRVAGGFVTLRLAGPSPARVMRRFAALLPVSRLDRSVRVRREELVEPGP